MKQGNLKKLVSSNIKRIMNQKGIRPTDICNNCDIGRETLRVWRAGKQLPQLDKLVLLANYLQVDLSHLIGDRLDEEQQEQYDLMRLDRLENYLNEMEFGAQEKLFLLSNARFVMWFMRKDKFGKV